MAQSNLAFSVATTSAPYLMAAGVLFIVIFAIYAFIKTKNERARIEVAARELTRDVQKKLFPGLDKVREAQARGEIITKGAEPTEASEDAASYHRPIEPTQPLPRPSSKDQFRADKVLVENAVKHQAALHPSQQPQWMVVVVTLLVLCSALFVILSNNVYDDSTKKWAFGAVGLVIGYWLNNKKH